MPSKPKYTVSRTDEVTQRDCTCSCTLPVTVYFSSGKEKKGVTAPTVKEQVADIKILEVE